MPTLALELEVWEEGAGQEEKEEEEAGRRLDNKK